MRWLTLSRKVGRIAGADISSIQRTSLFVVLVIPDPSTKFFVSGNEFQSKRNILCS
jgi:hypothetical protein